MLMLAIGCARPATTTLDDIAKRYVQAALQLAQHQPSLIDAWRGDQTWRPGPRRPVAETRRDIETAISDLASLERADLGSADRSRADYLRRQLAALDLAARRLLGEKMDFSDEVAAAFGTPLRPPDKAHVAAARDELARLLPGVGSLGERHRAFRRTIAIPRAHEADVLRAALDACRAATRAHIDLPSDETVDLRVGIDSQWDGFARYQGGHRSTIEISGRSPLDVSRALRLACHEAYPGHHTQDLLLDRLATTSHRVELLLQPAFGPHLLIAEGAAEVGADLAFPPEERGRVYREVLLPPAGLPADRAATLVAVEAAVFALEASIPDILAAYLDSRASREDTVSALANDAAVMDPEELLGFAEHQRTRAVTYVLGRQLVNELLSRGGDPWARLTSLFSTDGPMERINGKPTVGRVLGEHCPARSVETAQ
jgi:hypothetical protein